VIKRFFWEFPKKRLYKCSFIHSWYL